ncbi:hypothetical protein JYB62_04855 [Algoriphagus lutimaris]|uniref:hypothetical protein n=1 Tax=Algoriphagus lutimaris TaxID=613197 RepID=UPI00196A230D|nr:hypothetical protein [Algoriphagus lutimaris]MBN3519323.1 hypothetical protein [Algoriphagus lutimaris]
MKVFVLIFLLTQSSNFNMNENMDIQFEIYDLIKESESILDNEFGDPDPYEMMEAVFIGNPSISQIKPLVEGVLKKYSLPQTDEYRLKVASMLVSLRKHEEGKITEMQILKHIFYYGSNKIPLPDQAGFSVVFLLEGLI